MNILVLCTYPIESPRHGGQLRTRAIVDTYRAAGHQVQVAGVLGSESYAAETGFDAYPGLARLARVIPRPFLMEDVAIARLYAEDDERFARLAGKITIEPAVIHIEQPWLFQFAERLCAQRGWTIPLVYGSQNIEYRLKASILETYADSHDVSASVELVEALERHAIARAAAVVCVSQGDLDWTQPQTSAPVVLAPNGVRSWEVTDAGLAESQRIVREQRFALYCGSAHPPNMAGFFDLLGDGFGSLAPDQRLVIAGGAGNAIARDPRLPQSANLAERSIFAGMVSQPSLEGLLERAHCIILPLTQGGGTNLKTAEALWAGKHIVGTTVAFRGFETFMTAPGVAIADTPRDFKHAIRRAMNQPPLQLAEAERDRRRVVLWQECLRPLPALVETIVQQRG